ncbi:SRTD4 protein, partial [Eudromia elegans]|nr:SRTD4 protein [Eudromia elegans]
SQQADYGLSPYRSDDQAPAAEMFLSPARPHSGQEQAKFSDEKGGEEAERGGSALSCEALRGPHALEGKGKFYDYFETGCDDKNNTGESWKKSVRKKESLPSNKTCCSKGSKI